MPADHILEIRALFQALRRSDGAGSNMADLRRAGDLPARRDDRAGATGHELVHEPIVMGA